MVQAQWEYSLRKKDAEANTWEREHTWKLKDTYGKFKRLTTTARANGQNFDGATAALQSLRIGMGGLHTLFLSKIFYLIPVWKAFCQKELILPLMH